MTDWMTVRVVLHGREDLHLGLPPGRVLLAHASHSFAELAEAIDVAFGRWDLTPAHEFEVEGRRLLSDLEIADDDPEVEDSASVTLGQVGLRQAAPFRYVFDLGERWVHECDVEALGVDPFELYGEEPEVPVPVFGWGTIPDQYDRERETDDDERDDAADALLGRLADADDLLGLAEEGGRIAFVEPGGEAIEALAEDWDPDDDTLEAAWDEARAAAWAVVESALAEADHRRDDASLARVATRLRRARRGGRDSAEALLWAAADLEAVPDDDEELWLTLAAAVVEPRGDLPVDLDAEAAWAALEPADWAGAVIELVRSGVGTSASPEDLAGLAGRCPEIEGPELSEEDTELLAAGFTPVVGLWQALGALDDRGRLTPLGRWGLPLALRRAWTEE